MSNDGQDSGWAEFGHTVMRAQARTPAKLELVDTGNSTEFVELLEWAKASELDCPKILGFDFERAAQVIRDRLTTGYRRTRASSSSAFANLLGCLTEAQDKWSEVLGAHLGLTVERFIDDQPMVDGMSDTIKELNTIFKEWSKLRASGPDVPEGKQWENVLSEVSMLGEELTLTRTNHSGYTLPFFLWETHFYLPGRVPPLKFDSTEIAAWFVLFSLSRLYALLVSLSDRVLPQGGKVQTQVDPNELVAYMDEAQEALTIAGYWHENIYSLDGKLKAFREKVNADAMETALLQVEVPNAPWRALGLLRLFEWFKSSSSNKAGTQQWQAFWMAKYDQPEPTNNPCSDTGEVLNVMLENRISRQAAIMKIEFEQALEWFQENNERDYPLEKSWPKVLAREQINPKVGDIKQVIIRLLRGSPESANETFRRAHKQRSDHNNNCKRIKKEFQEAFDSALEKAEEMNVAAFIIK